MASGLDSDVFGSRTDRVYMGGGGPNNGGGAGGSSYISGLGSSSTTSGVQTGDGEVTISYQEGASIPALGGIGLFLLLGAIAGVGVLVIRRLV